jgi:hypothetical protein
MLDRGAEEEVSLEMDPAAVFSFIQSADLLGFSGTEATSRFIRFWSSSRYSHVALCVWITSPVRRLCVSDAVPGEGVRLVPIESFVTWQGPVEHFELCGLDRQAMVESALGRWMHAYPHKRQLWRSFGGIIQVVHDWLGTREDFDVRAVHCAEHISRSLLDCGVTLPKPATKMSPGLVLAQTHNGAPICRSTGRFSIRARLKHGA